MTPEEAKSGSSGSNPYSTGGGGVVLEHEYAASVLASLLLAESVDGLGDEFTPIEVAMQQGASSPVDDVVIRGTAPGGDRTLHVACRRRPTIGKSDASTVALFADFLRVIVGKSDAIEADRLRLGLAFAAPFGPATELALLTEVARRQPGYRAFADALNAEGAYTAAVRARLKNIEEIVDAAITQLPDAAHSVHDLTLRLLRGLFLIPLQLEGDVAPGRTQLVRQLQSLTATPAQAEDLRLRLVAIASQDAIRAGAITRPMLRAALRPFGPFGASRDFPIVQSQLALLESELQARTPRSVPVPGSGTTFTVDRSALETELVEALIAAPAGGVIILHGEPDVGKSALALAAADSIRATGGAVLAISLRDLPSAPADLKTALGLAPADLFAAAPSAPTAVVIFDGAEVVQERDAGTVGALVTAASAAGHTTLLVVRDDALEPLVDLVKSRGRGKPTRFSVGSLSREELQTLLSAVPDLLRLTKDARARWLLSRIGLVELLLKAAERGSSLPETLSSEAEVFATVWTSLIRQDERTVDGVSPDDRETALLDVAQQLLSPNGLDPIPWTV